MKLKRVALYARVSTTEQAEEGYSIDAQINSIRLLCDSLGKVVVKEYVDRGISGKSIEKRLSLQELMEDAKSDVFDEVIVWKINRLARNHLDLLKIVEHLDKYEIGFRSVTEPFDTSSAVGKLLLNMLGSIGEFERETIVEQVRAGMLQKSREGGFNGGRMIGYKSVRISENNSQTRLVINPSEAEIVKLIFKLYVSGKGYKYIANYLNELGYKTIRNKQFSIQGIRLIVSNPAYVGKIRYNNYVNYSKNKRKGTEDEFVLVEGMHDPIIDQETWLKAQTILLRRSKHQNKIIKGIFLLTGLLKCPECGASMVAGRVSKKMSNGKKQSWKYYQCSRFKNYGKSVCSANSIRADYAEDYVLSQLWKALLDDEFINEVVGNINRHVEEHVKPLKDRLKVIEKWKSSYEDKKDKLFSLYEDELIDKIEFKERRDKLDLEKSKNEEMKLELMKQIRENKQTEKIPVKKVKSLLKSFGNVLGLASRNERKLLYNLVIEKVTINKDRTINKIFLRFDNKLQMHLSEDSSENEESSFFVLNFNI